LETDMTLRKSLLAIAALSVGLWSFAPVHAQSTTTSSSKTSTRTTHTSSTGMANPMHKSAAKSAPTKKVDINTATEDELKAVPGIGDAIADKIVANRPFTNKRQLLDKGLVNKAQYGVMSPHIIASHASMTGASSATTTGSEHASATGTSHATMTHASHASMRHRTHASMTGTTNAATTHTRTRAKHTATDTPTTSGQ
jgi:hypothetical protein